MTRIFLLLTLLIASLTAPVAARGQVAPYKFDFGGGLGMSGYIGDANSTNPFAHPGFTADLSMRYILDTRWAFKASLQTMGLSGDTQDIDNVLPDLAHFTFTSQVWDLSVRCEFNFFNYGIGETYKRLRRWSPYLAVGLGCSMASSDGNTAAGLSLPFAFGVKFKLKPRINLHAEFSMTKVFNDKVDGQNLADVNGIKTDFYKNTDWFSRLSIGISYEFGKRCETCHYVE